MAEIGDRRSLFTVMQEKERCLERMRSGIPLYAGDLNGCVCWFCIDTRGARDIAGE